MEHSEAVAWAGRLTRTAANVVRERRAALRMSATDVAAECERLGYPIPRVVVTKLENGYRQHLTVAELLVLAKALRISPLQLIAPVGQVGDVEVLPGQQVSPWTAWQWASGTSFEWPAVDERVDGDDYVDGVRPLTLWIDHARLVERWAVERSNVYSRRLRDQGDRELEHELLSAKLGPIERDLVALRSACRQWGIALPPLPDDLRAAIVARGGEVDGVGGAEA